MDNYKYKDLTEEQLHEIADKAINDYTTWYTVHATGNTYPLKDELQNWAFFWDAQNKRWTNECAAEAERLEFELHLRDGSWPEIELEFIEHEKICDFSQDSL